MFNAINLLGSMLQQRSAPSAGQRLGAAFGQGGPLGGLLSQFSGGAGGGAMGSLMSAFSGRGRDPDADQRQFMDVARRAASNPRQEIASNNPLAVGGLGALAGTLLGGGRGAVGGGLLAVLGSLAYSALQSGQSSQSSATPVSEGSGGYARPGATPPAMTEDDVQHTAMLVLRSMIQAAKADGQIDPVEIERITGKIGQGDPADAAEARAFVLQQMGGPLDLAGLVREVRSPVEAAEVYAAALLAIEVDTVAEHDYLARLATELRLEPNTVAHLHTSLSLPPPG